MSLRRPFRDSWEQRKYKRTARSLSPSAQRPSWTPIHKQSSSPERPALASTPARHDSHQSAGYVNPTVEDDTDSDDYYPERLALTPEPEVGQGDASKDDSSTTLEALFGQAVPPRGSASPVLDSLVESESRSLDFASRAATVGAVPLRALETQIPSTRPESDPDTIYPEDSASNIQSVSSVAALVTDNFGSSTIYTDLLLPNPSSATDIETTLLSSPTFPVHLLRPVSDLPTLLTQIAPVLGDPGTVSGPVHFGAQPQTLQDTIFDHWTLAKRQKWLGPYDPLKDSILKEKPVDANKQNHLQWERDIRVGAFDLDSYTVNPLSSSSRSRNRSSARSTVSSTTSTRSSAITAATTKPPWKTRQYSTNPHLRTRHLSIDLLQCKISHGELLSLNLSIDARRDAIAIGGAAGDIGGSLIAGLPTSDRAGMGRAVDGASASGSSIGPRSSSSNTLRTSASNSNSRQTRSSARNASMSVASTSSGPAWGSSATRRSRENGYDEYNQRGRRYRSGGVNASFGTGRYGSGGVMLWRLVRVGACAGGEGGGEEHVAWWCVPERSLGGFF